MKKAKKIFVIYLVASSVILHCIAICAIIWFASAMMSGAEIGTEAVRAFEGQATNLAIIKDISTLNQGNYSYVGYAVDFKGQTLYVMGSPAQSLKVGDQVAMIISKHPYDPLKALVIVVAKNGH